MRKISYLLLLVLINVSCSSKFKSIDRKVLKIEKLIDKENLYDPFNTVYITKIGNEIKKIKIIIESEDNCEEYYRNCEIYFENNVPILITEVIKSRCTYQNSDVDRYGRGHGWKNEINQNINHRIYVYNWDKFDVDVIGGSKYLISKQGYDKLINKTVTSFNRAHNNK